MPVLDNPFVHWLFVPVAPDETAWNSTKEGKESFWMMDILPSKAQVSKILLNCFQNHGQDSRMAEKCKSEAKGF